MSYKNWENLDLIKLSFYKGLTPSLIVSIVEEYDSYYDFSHADLPHNLNLIINQGELFKRGQIKPDVEAKKIEQLIDDHNIKVLSFWDANYPALLKQIHQFPPLLFYKGNLPPADENYFSVVGTRKCSSYGKINAERFSRYFATKGVTIVSGLAHGIDTIAHLSTIDSGGKTIAFIASGIDKLGPSTAVRNAKKIVETGGAVISMFRPGVKALPPYFLQRNRLISGISKATLIIESREKGGSLNTAKFARDQNRDVYALPGNISSEQSVGTNSLIKNGLAILAQSPEQIYSEINYQNTRSILFDEPVKINFKNIDEELVYGILSFEPIHIDELAIKTEIDVSQLLVTLLNLEFSGAVKQLPGKYYIRS